MTASRGDRVELTEPVEGPETGRRYPEGTAGLVVDDGVDTGARAVELEQDDPEAPDGGVREVVPLRPEQYEVVEARDFDALRDYEWGALQAALDGGDPREVARRVVSYRKLLNWNHAAEVLMPAARRAADALEDGSQDDLALACRALCAAARDVRDDGDDPRPDALLVRALELAEEIEDSDDRDLLRARALFDRAVHDLWHSREEAAEERLNEVVDLLAERVGRMWKPDRLPDDGDREAKRLHHNALSLLVEDRTVHDE